VSPRWAGKIFKSGVALALAFVGLTVTAAQSAMAAGEVSIEGCTQYFYYNLVQGQVDNCPGNGAASWAWVWSGSNTSGLSLKLTDGEVKSLITSGPGNSASASYSSDIAQVRLCEKNNSPRGAWYCGDWHSV
jgi:hypothetical protein